MTALLSLNTAYFVIIKPGHQLFITHVVNQEPGVNCIAPAQAEQVQQSALLAHTIRD